jgi:hypothetical protein
VSKNGLEVQAREKGRQSGYRKVLDTVLSDYENSELYWQNPLAGCFKAWLSKAISRKLGLV